MTLVKRSTWPSDPFYEMDRLFNRAFGGRDFWPETLSSTVGRDFPLDVYGDDDRYYVVAELPGVSRDAIDLKVQNAVLSITVAQQEDDAEGSQTRRMTRSITVGDDIAVDQVTAKLDCGLLTVTLPKAAERKPRRIAVGEGDK